MIIVACFWSDFDDDDPLAGLLSDEDDDIGKKPQSKPDSKPPMTPASKPATPAEDPNTSCRGYKSVFNINICYSKEICWVWHKT